MTPEQQAAQNANPLLRLRQARKWSRVDLWKAMQAYENVTITPSILQSWETGRSFPAPLMLSVLGAIFEENMEALWDKWKEQHNPRKLFRRSKPQRSTGAKKRTATTG